MGKKSHNKRRNTALLHEFLVRHISKCLLEDRTKEAQSALNICRRYFHKGSLLQQEFSLFKIITEEKVSSKDSVSKLLDEVYRESVKINVRKLDECKSKLIKEINSSFDVR